MQELWLIWRRPGVRRYKVGSLVFDGHEYIFKYTNPELDDAKKDGFLYFPGFENIDRTYKSGELFLNILNRLPNAKRPDYLEILNRYGLQEGATPMDILSATKGRLVTDTYEFVPAFDRKKIEFDVAGVNHRKADIDYDKISVNDRLTLENEFDNRYDHNAIKVILNGYDKKVHIGYVPRYYSRELSRLLDSGINYSALVKGVRPQSVIKDECVSVVVKLVFGS